MRVAQYALPRAAGDTQDAELVVYYFGGTGGTVEANIERWVGQMQQPDGRPSSAVAKRQSRTVNGLKVTLVDVPGTYVAEMTPGASAASQQPELPSARGGDRNIEWSVLHQADWTGEDRSPRRRKQFEAFLASVKFTP